VVAVERGRGRSGKLERYHTGKEGKRERGNRNKMELATLELVPKRKGINSSYRNQNQCFSVYFGK